MTTVWVLVVLKLAAGGGRVAVNPMNTTQAYVVVDGTQYQQVYGGTFATQEECEKVGARLENQRGFKKYSAQCSPQVKE